VSPKSYKDEEVLLQNGHAYDLIQLQIKHQNIMLEEQEIANNCKQENQTLKSERDEYQRRVELTNSLSAETEKINKEEKKKLTKSLTEAEKKIEETQKEASEAEYQKGVKSAQNEKIRRDLEKAQQELAKSSEDAKLLQEQLDIEKEEHQETIKREEATEAAIANALEFDSEEEHEVPEGYIAGDKDKSQMLKVKYSIIKDSYKQNESYWTKQTQN
jgi:hypothetical protein